MLAAQRLWEAWTDPLSKDTMMRAACFEMRAMSDDEQDEIERINKRMTESMARDKDRPIAIHEAGHAVVALDLGLPLISVDIVARDGPDGPKFGGTKLRDIRESFSTSELEEHSLGVIAYMRKHLIMLHAGEAAAKLILKRTNDPLAQRDQSGILSACRSFPELAETAVMQGLTDTAENAVSSRRADIEKVADALIERMSLNADEVRQLIGGYV
jgi:hypothetical protein